MFRSLVSVLVASVLYVVVYVTVSARLVLSRASGRPTNGAGFLEVVSVPAWWVVLLVGPPVVILVWWLLKRPAA